MSMACETQNYGWVDTVSGVQRKCEEARKLTHATDDLIDVRHQPTMHYDNDPAALGHLYLGSLDDPHELYVILDDRHEKPLKQQILDELRRMELKLKRLRLDLEDKFSNERGRWKVIIILNDGRRHVRTEDTYRDARQCRAAAANEACIRSARVVRASDLEQPSPQDHDVVTILKDGQAIRSELIDYRRTYCDRFNELRGPEGFQAVPGVVPEPIE